MSEVTTVGDALPEEIKRVQAKRERWLGYAKDAGPQVMFGPALHLMQAAVSEGIDAQTSGDVVRQIRALESLRDFDDDD